MTEQDRSEDDDLVVRVVDPPVSRWFYALAAVLLGNALAQALQGSEPARWVLLPVTLLYAAVVVTGRVLAAKRPSELVMTRDSLILRPGVGRVRRYPWSEVTRLDIDPPGGPRMVNIHLRPRRFCVFGALPEGAVPAVKARWSEVKQ